MTWSVAQVTQMLAFMVAAEGKKYTQQNPTRFGPNEYDCSGLIYAAANAAGIKIPQGDAIASSEAEWLAGQKGTQIITNASQIKTGDVLFFTGAAPDASQFGPIGHVGMALSPTQYVSAYDTQDGVTVKPISGDHFVVDVRLTGGNVNAPASSSAANDLSSLGGLGGLLSIPTQIVSFFTDLDKAVVWLSKPSDWLRIVAFIGGVILLLLAIRGFILAAEGESPLKSPDISVMPIPV